jgi:hypothetical protein
MQNPLPLPLPLNPDPDSKKVYLNKDGSGVVVTKALIVKLNTKL